MFLKDLFDQFVKERIYLKNITPKTVSFHRDGWTSFSRRLPEIVLVEQLSKNVITDFLAKLRESGIKTVTINTYCRSLNAFFRWLYENELMKGRLKIPKLPDDRELVKTLPENNMKALLSFKPATFGERRIHTLCLTIIDTGIRINEALSLKISDLDFDNMLIKLMGKGRKERRVPFSFELRKSLVKFLKSFKLSPMPQDRFVFGTREGGKLNYDNARRDYSKMCKKLGIPKLGAFHRMRHTFASNYVRAGGNLMYLQKVLGHAELSTTKIYVEVDTESLKETQMKTSLLGRLM